MESSSGVHFGGDETIDFTPPSGFMIVPWVISLLAVTIGLLWSFISLVNNDYTMVTFGGILAVPGCLLVIWLTPTRLEKTYNEIRIEEKPRDFVHRSETGGRTGSFWTGHYSNSPKKDDRGWVFSAPGPEHWDKEDRYGPDEMGIIPEHPTVIGTPIPATISADGIFTAIIALYSIPVSILSVNIGMNIMQSAGDSEEWFFGLILVIGPALFSIGYAISSWQTGTKMQLTIDVPTSKIRSMAAGELELVGQVRRWASPAPAVSVGGDPARTYQNLHSWRWLYEIYLRRTRIVMTDDGPRTKTEYRWETIAQENGGYNFIMHDGTGGVLVKPDTFADQNLGQYIREWKVDHNRNLGEIFGSMITTTFGGWTILEHKWTLWGMALGDPCYILGKATNRSKETKGEMEVIKRNDQHTLMEVIGKSGVGFEARLERGTELGVLGRVKSQLEYKIIPGIVAAGCLAGTYLAMTNIGF